MRIKSRLRGSNSCPNVPEGYEITSELPGRPSAATKNDLQPYIYIHPLEPCIVRIVDGSHRQ